MFSGVLKTASLIALMALVMPGCGPAVPVASDSMPLTPEDNMHDSLNWLEEIDGARALTWVKERNGESLSVLEAEPGFAEYRARAQAILAAPDRIAMPDLMGDMVYNFWQDSAHERGIWRRATLASYTSGEPAWQIVLDLDALAERESENWVWKGANCLEPDYRRCILLLSRGGKDAAILREFDTEKAAFVTDGFNVAEAKTWFDWYDRDHLMIGSDFGPGSRTQAGYPREIRLWRRGTPLASATPLTTVPEQAVGAMAVSRFSRQRADRLLIDALSFFTNDVRHLRSDGKQIPWPLPHDAEYKALLNGHMIALLRHGWQHGDQEFLPGSLVAYAIDPLLNGAPPRIESVLVAGQGQAIRDAVAAGDRLYVSLMDNVAGRLLMLQRADGIWQSAAIALPQDGTITLISADASSDHLFVIHESYLTSERLFMITDAQARLVQALPQRFDPNAYQVAQQFARSKDGTSVPYFVVGPKSMAANGDNPVWLHGYGGFEVPLTPSYIDPAIQFWLEEGGVYAVANIRGGGEFGPSWHQAARGPNRQRAFDDFAAVAQDLIDSGITTPQRLGIAGRSNGGLLTAVQLTQRPSLFGAVIIGVPLTDMMRYDKLLAGASWRDEYGDPSDPETRDYLLRYSPYHKVKDGTAYPEAFVYTSTKDDRVHPGHARKLTARLIEAGAAILYYENIEGGHAGVANLNQAAHRQALELVYMKRRLMQKKAP